jgi:hypothetical protein
MKYHSSRGRAPCRRSRAPHRVHDVSHPNDLDRGTNASALLPAVGPLTLGPQPIGREPPGHIVGLGRFELPTPCPPDKCANQAALQPAIADDRPDRNALRVVCAVAPLNPGAKIQNPLWEPLRTSCANSLEFVKNEEG